MLIELATDSLGIILRWSSYHEIFELLMLNQYLVYQYIRY